MSKQKAKIDLWLKQIAPSGSIRKWFAHDPNRWMEFQRRYHEDLRKQTGLTKQIRQLERKYHTITLVFSARDQRHNQAVALRAFLQRRGLR
jgi:uncharacterized protein YeaO (DUF488 family)